MKIIDVVTSAGVTGFYFDDQKAIKMGAEQDGFAYRGAPLTPGFSAVRQKGESISIMLLLEDGQIACGDCAAVQYSGAGGRDPLFLATEFLPVIKKLLVPKLQNREITSFKSMAAEFDQLQFPDGRKLHTAIRYGVTQALLDAVAKKQHKTMAEVVAAEYGTTLARGMIPIFAQTGDDRYHNADKCILKRAQVLPHGLVNSIATKLGKRGELLLRYIEWLKGRVFELGDDCYRPVLHIDVYGTIGMLFEDDLGKITTYLREVATAASPLKIRIEGPVDAGSKEGQIKALLALHEELHNKQVAVEIVADEWCNTLEDIKEFVDARACDMVQIKTPDLGGINNIIEAVLYAKNQGIGAYMGGTCNETDRSAQVCVHLALATQPDQILAKPGMGVDEGYMITYNEMQRTLALLQARNLI